MLTVPQLPGLARALSGYLSADVPHILPGFGCGSALLATLVSVLPSRLRVSFSQVAAVLEVVGLRAALLRTPPRSCPAVLSKSPCLFDRRGPALLWSILG